MVYLVFFSTLGLSICAYRLSPFHPLANIPGPKLSRLTKLYSVYIAYTGQQHIRLKNLHDEFGPIVRIGPNEISVIDVASMKDVLGSSGLPKSPFYTSRIAKGGSGSLLLTNGHEHATRRRRWARAMTSASLKSYQDILLIRTNQLVEKLNALSGPACFASWMNYFTFDFMGDMAFGGGIEMMRSDGKDGEGFWELIEHWSLSMVTVSQIPWIYQTYFKIPFLSKYNVQMAQYGAQKAIGRMQKGAEKKDIWYHLPSVKEVAADGMLAVIAGSDTTSAVMCALFYCLLRDRPCYERLQQEVDEVLSTTECAVKASAATLPYMAACINETLRLFPPIPTNGPRIVPKGSGGRTLAGYFVPEGTYVYVPPYAIHRHAGHFSPSPDRFMPERWLSPKNGTLNIEAFIPFSYGPSNCVAKQLALQEMFTLTGVLMRKFDVVFGEGFDWRRWEEGVRDWYVTTRPGLEVVFRPRVSGV
ncbi:cytochrome P450 [Hymenopellis radicata]|nr:cytochrome P450 [Hymenopellis radicata]